jgi:hypothetical protein
LHPPHNADRLERNWNKLRTNIAAKHIQRRDQSFVQSGGMTENFIYVRIGRFHAFGFTNRTHILCAGVNVIFFARAIPKQRGCEERIWPPDVVLFNQHDL